MKKVLFAGLILASSLLGLFAETASAEPNLVAWWKFDEGQGTTAYDSAGENDGTVYGAQWTTGQVGGALSFDGGNDYVVVPDSASLDITDQITLEAWVLIRDVTSEWDRIVVKAFAGSVAPYNVYGIHRVAGSRKLVFVISTGANLPNGIGSDTDVLVLNEWTHVAGTFDGSTLSLFVNGELIKSHDAGYPGHITTNNIPLSIGANNVAGREYLNGKIDEVRIYDEALSAAKIQQLYQERLRSRAFGPNPADGATVASSDEVLSWMPGKGAPSHDVYFGTNYSDVKNATTFSSEYMGNQEANSFSPGGLELGTSYYWRIDEVEGLNTWKGDVWSFTAEGRAKNPHPVDGTRYVRMDATLTWDAGFDAVSHDVYFGTSISPPFQANQTETIYVPGMMDANTTYYWRIDEVGPGGTITGDLWSFTTGSHRGSELRIIAWNIQFLGARNPLRTQEQLDALAERMAGFEADIFALQEISVEDTLIQVREQMGPEWQHIRFSGENVLLYNTETVELIESAWWSDLGLEEYPTYPGAWHRAPTYGRFKQKGTNNLDFAVISVHFHWAQPNIRVMEGEAVKMKIDELLASQNVNAVILAGDLNCEPDEDAHPPLQSGGHLLYLLPKENGSNTGFWGAIDHFYVTQAARDLLPKKSAFVIRPEHYGETPNEFRQTYSDHYPISIELGTHPAPADRAIGVSTDVVLRWLTRSWADSYDVYFGTNFDNVNNADSSWPVGTSVYKGNLPFDANSYDPGGLEPNTNYYWRLDEVRDSDPYSPYKGQVWSFTTRKIVYVPTEYPTIEEAINLAWDGVTIIVEQGTYYENINFNGKYLTITSIDPNDPNIVANTIIDGNNLGTVVTFSNFEDANSVLAGFTITNGKSPYGGGIYCSHSSPTITNCTFTGNSARYGHGGGGGIHCFYSSPIITNCNIVDNSAYDDGGGMYNDDHSNPTLTNCTFRDNSAYRGGGMFNMDDSSPTVTNCTFSCNNASAYGGGMYNYWSSPKLVNCTFSGNSTNYHGGGMYNSGGSPTVTNCTFTGNSANYHGGGMNNRMNSSPTVTNCTFIGNSAQDGGAIYSIDFSSPTVTNCTFTDNSANRDGGGMYNWNRSSPTVSNCILWSNTASSGGNEIYNYDTSSIPVISYCDIAGCGSSGAGWDDDLGDDGGGNIDADPLFVGPGVGDLRLLPDSACIDAGDNTAVPPDSADLDGDGDTTEPTPIDLAGNPRFVDQPEVPDTGNGTAPIVDMGAYEANYIEVPMKFTPKALNLRSKGKWVKAHFVLPEGFLPEDVDANTPAKIGQLSIESAYVNVFIDDGLVEIEAAFSRSAFCGAGIDYGPADVVVIGKLISGQDFYGTDTIRIIANNINHLAVLASYWLQASCGAPDWCNGADLDRDSEVNFVDFAMFDGCCIEVVKE